MKSSAMRRLLAFSTLSIVIGTVSTSALADDYEVTITNVTANQAFTPRLLITHTAGKLFVPGSPAVEELTIIAEGGNLAPLISLLEDFPGIVTDIQVGDGLLMPGTSQTVTVNGEPGDFFSLVNMLIPTNDAFLGINAVTLPTSGNVSHKASVYDAGSEVNDENCTNIPGPVCGGAGDSPGDEAEGFVHIHPGIHGIGDLDAALYDWNNPAAIITITKI